MVQSIWGQGPQDSLSSVGWWYAGNPGSRLEQWLLRCLEDGEWDEWLPHSAQLLKLHPSGVAGMERRIAVLSFRLSLGARGGGKSEPLRDPFVFGFLGTCDDGMWGPLFHNSTSPDLVAYHLVTDIPERGTGVVGKMDILKHV